ncbi:hypothetical protein [Saccharospirillum sp.]|uniref:TA system antitoxin ParD family protein n=1 Tax=Saccharospirillum sp. TaxID=2033801 RepID=UPI0034A038A6
MRAFKSPYRIDEDLMHLALIAGTTQHRKPIEQLEYWAELGRKVEQQLSLEVLRFLLYINSPYPILSGL